MRKQLLTFAAPVMCLALLGGMVAENRAHLRAEDTDSYHAEAKAAVLSIHQVLGPWVGRDTLDQIPQSAFQLLKPNVIFSRTYVDNDPKTGTERWAMLMITQCRYASDMAGHWPRICYPANGQKMVREEPREWKLGGMTIPGTEFEFSENRAGRPINRVVYNFLIIPHRGVAREMKAVYQAAEDYQRRYYGAAQFQVLMSGMYSQQERDGIFADLVGPNVPVIRTLLGEGKQP